MQSQNLSAFCTHICTSHTFAHTFAFHTHICTCVCENEYAESNIYIEMQRTKDA